VIPRNLLAFACSTVALAAVPWPGQAYAQHRVVHSGPRPVVVVSAYRPFFYDPWYPYFYGYPHFYGYPPPYGFPYDDRASLRIQVKPRDAQVFVDGYLAGTVDDFDGVFQRLHLPPGQHDIEIYRDGYRSVRQKLYLSPGEGYNVHQALEALKPGEAPDPRPSPPPPSASRQGPYTSPAPRRGPARPPLDERSAYGTLALRIQPADADVLIDGERWQGSAGDEHLLVQLRAGSHRVEVRKDAFETFASDVHIKPGETTPLNVSLSARR
jgi:hypothetical protein